MDETRLKSIRIVTKMEIKEIKEMSRKLEIVEEIKGKSRILQNFLEIRKFSILKKFDIHSYIIYIVLKY